MSQELEKSSKTNKTYQRVLDFVEIFVSPEKLVAFLRTLHLRDHFFVLLVGIGIGLGGYRWLDGYLPEAWQIGAHSGKDRFIDDLREIGAPK